MLVIGMISSMAMAQAPTPPTVPPGSESDATPVDASAVPGVADIVVTAQRRAQRLQDVPVAVSVVAGPAIVKQNLTNLESISARLPDVKIVAGPLTDFLNIRGVGSGQNAGFEQSVGTFVDGLYRGRGKSTQAALFDVDQVEVLKGPQSTFFGNNTVAGALNITTRKPAHKFEYNGSAYYGFEYGEYNVEGGISAPITDELAVRVAGRVSGMDGYIDDRGTGHDAPRNRNLIGRVSIRWEPSSNWRTDARFDIGRQRSRDAFAAVVLNCPSPLAGPFDVACPAIVANNGGPTGSEPNYRSYARPSLNNYDFKEAEITNTLNLGAASLSSISGYFHHNLTQLVQLIPSSSGGVLGYDLAPSPGGEKVTQFSQELRLQSTAPGFFEWMIGGYYSHLSTDQYSRFGGYFLPFGAFNPLGTTTAATPITAGVTNRFRDETWSGFGSATLRPTDKLRFNLGLRYTSVTKKGTRNPVFGMAPNADFSQFTPFDPVTTSVIAAILGSDLGDFPDKRRRDDKFLPSAGVQYDLTEDMMAYFAFTKGFKAGGFSAANQINTFGPERVDAYEAGIKSILFDRKLTLNANVFRSDYSGLQETTITFNPLPVNGVANAARSRAQGVEISAVYQPTRMVRFSTDIAYLDSKYGSYPNGVCTMAQTAAVPVGCVQDMSGKRRPYAPKFSGNVAADIGFPIGENAIHFSPLIYFNSAFFTTATADPLLRQKGFAKVDLRVSYGPQSGRWEFAVVGKNLTDKVTASYRNPLTAGNGSVYTLPDPPRSIALQLTIKG